MGHICDVLEDSFEKSKVFLKNFFMNRHLIELIKNKSNINMKLPVNSIGVKVCRKCLNDLIFSSYFHVYFFKDLVFLQSETWVNFRNNLFLVLLHQVLMHSYHSFKHFIVLDKFFYHLAYIVDQKDWCFLFNNRHVFLLISPGFVD